MSDGNGRKSRGKNVPYIQTPYSVYFAEFGKMAGSGAGALTPIQFYKQEGYMSGDKELGFLIDALKPEFINSPAKVRQAWREIQQELIEKSQSIKAFLSDEEKKQLPMLKADGLYGIATQTFLKAYMENIYPQEIMKLAPKAKKGVGKVVEGNILQRT